MTNPATTFAELRELGLALANRSLNEADTRHKIIDLILHQVLAWPRNRTSCEEYIRPGYADYVLKRASGDHVLFVEAKKSGDFFTLPAPYGKDELATFVLIQKLLSDASIKAAMEQVRSYCIDTGCEFACVTNGHEWIFFKTFEKGKKWETLQAFVVRSLEFFEKEYTRAYNSFSYNAITESSSLAVLLTSAHPKDRNVFYPKERIASYSHPVNPNRLAGYLRPIVNRYFGVIDDADHEFMDRCYVSQRDYAQTLDGMRGIILDTISPYFESYGVGQLEDTGHGGRLGGRLTKNLKSAKGGEVLILFGGKGSGKSTFIKRLLHHNPPRWLRENAVIAITDLLNTPDDKSAIQATIWQGLVARLDTDAVMSADRDRLIKELFADRFAIASKQELAGLDRTSEAYNGLLNKLVSDWKSDLRHVASQLARRHQESGKGIIVVLDNTDQYSSTNQDYCFSAAQEISAKLDCATLISMREERFYNSKIHGLLDAYQNAGFHISSPKPSQVFQKRLDFVVDMLRQEMSKGRVKPANQRNVRESSSYLHIVSKEFSSDRSPLNSFLSACAHGDTRLSLDLFRSFLLSGYTNVEEIMAAGRWSFLIHQVIKPVMIPNRYFYDEKLSEIPNIYQLRHSRHSSHFTGLRILRKLAKKIDGGVGYVAVAELRAHFAEKFNMLEDFEANIDVFLKRGLVESNNRVDEYSDSVDSVKITNYGLYILRELAYFFAYFELVSIDSGVFDESVSNYIVESARDEYQMFTQKKRVDRVKRRLERVEQFIEYLHAEEERERDQFGLEMPKEDMFTFKALADFSVEKDRVLLSAQRQGVRYDARGGR